MTQSKRAFLILFLSIFIDLIGFGIVLPLLPFYAQSFGASASTVTMLFSIYSLAGFVANPFWGRLSDRIGRRPLLLLSLAGSGIAYFWFSLATSLITLFLARALAGIMSCSIVIAQAYIGDITTPENRSKGMGVIGAAFGLGFILGPALAGILVGVGDEPNLRLPLFAAAATSGIALILAWFLLPESSSVVSVSGESQAETDPQSPEPLQEISPPISSVIRDNPVIAILMGLSFLLPFGLLGANTILALWLGQAWEWGAQQVGYLFVLVGVMASIVQGGLIGPLVKRLGERRVLLVGLGSASLGLIALPQTHQILTLILAVITYNVGESLCRPSLSGLLSQSVSGQQQGQFLGMAQSAGALAAVTGPLVAGLLFEHIHPAAPFLMSAVLMVAQGILVWGGLRKSPQPAT